MAVATDSEPAALERVVAGDTTFRLSRVTYAPGSVIVPDEEVAMALAGVESGAVERRTATSDGEFTMGFSPGAGVSLGIPEGVERTWTVSGDDPAVLLLLSVIPEATQPSTE